MHRDKSERGPKITKASGLKKLLEKLENQGIVLDRRKQATLPGGVTEDDMNVEQYKQALRLLIKEDAEKAEVKPAELN